MLQVVSIIPKLEVRQIILQLNSNVQTVRYYTKYVFYDFEKAQVIPGWYMSS